MPAFLPDVEAFDAREALSSTYVDHLPLFSQTLPSPIKLSVPTPVTFQPTTVCNPPSATTHPLLSFAQPSAATAVAQPGSGLFFNDAFF